MEVLLVWGNSREVIQTQRDDLGKEIKSRLKLQNVIPFDNCPSVKGNYILQRWSGKWQCFVDCKSVEEIEDGDKMTVVECDADVTSTVRSLCKGLAKPSNATARTLTRLFPGTVKRKFDPLSDCVNADNKRKKKAAVPQHRGRPKIVPVVYLSKNPKIIPKGNSRELLRKQGRIQDVPLFRYMSCSEVKESILEVFPNFSKEFIYLQGHKDNTLSVYSERDLDGNGALALARHGSLYLLENAVNSGQPAVNSGQSAANSGQSAINSESTSGSSLRSLLLSNPGPSTSTCEERRSILVEKADRAFEKLKNPVIVVEDGVPGSEAMDEVDKSDLLPEGYSYDDCVFDSSSDDEVADLRAKEAVRASITSFRQICMQQDAEYLESLEIDRAKEAKKKENLEWAKPSTTLMDQCVNSLNERIQDLQSYLRSKFSEYQQSGGSDGVSLSFKLPTNEKVSFVFENTASMKDVYQFVAKDIAPPFILSLPHPYLQLPLSDVCGRPAKAYHNHLMVVETSEDSNSFKLDLLYDTSSQDSVALAMDTTKEKKCTFGTAVEREKQRLLFMESINATRGQVRNIGRKTIFEDVVDLYSIGEIVGECPIEIKYVTEDAIDDGGVQRDMFSGFWEEAYAKLFEGSNVLIPMVHPHMDMMVFSTLGRILSHGYLVCGHLPVRIALPTLMCMILGPSTKVPVKILLDAFLDYISYTERDTLKEALKLVDGKFPASVQDTLLTILSKFGCRRLPTPNTLMSCIQRVAEYEFIAKPAAAISLVHSGIPSSHKAFWKSKSIDEISQIFCDLTVSAAKICELLVLPATEHANEERVYGYFTTMIGNMGTDELRSLVRFITGSSVCSSKDILVTFNSVSGLARCPSAHTCDSTIELSSTYMNYEEFYADFQAILSKVNREFAFRMDAL